MLVSMVSMLSTPLWSLFANSFLVNYIFFWGGEARKSDGVRNNAGSIWFRQKIGNRSNSTTFRAEGTPRIRGIRGIWTILFRGIFRGATFSGIWGIFRERNFIGYRIRFSDTFSPREGVETTTIFFFFLFFSRQRGKKSRARVSNPPGGMSVGRTVKIRELIGVASVAKRGAQLH